MKTKYWFILLAVTGLLLVGCDSIPGMGNQQQAPPAQVPPGMAPPAQPVPGQPVAQPVPGQPVALPIPGQPVAPIPGQPVAVAPTPVPQPVAQPVAPPVTGDVLIDRLNAEKTKVAADWIATSTMVRQRLAKAKNQAFQVQLPGPPYCHTYVAVGDDNVKNLDIVIDSPTGIPEAKDSIESNVAAIQNHCPNVAGAYKVNVAMAKGDGEFAIQVYSKAR